MTSLVPICHQDKSTANEVEMTEEFLIQQCKDNQGYRTPELNEKLYLHHFGFTSIKNLEPYTGLKVLYLSHNAVSSLSPLHTLVNLDSLYLAHNALQSLETLPVLPKLRLLDVSHNYLTQLGCTENEANISETVPALEILLASHNIIAEVGEATGALPLLTALDLSHNKLRDWEPLKNSLSLISSTLATLILNGNAIVHSTVNYRRNVVHAFPQLCYLDEHPVFSEERRRAEAFALGGVEGEQQALLDLKQEEDQRRKTQFEFFTREREQARQRHVADKIVSSTQYFNDQMDDVYIPV